MAKPPLKGLQGSPAQTHPTSSGTRQTRSATAALEADKSTERSSPPKSTAKKNNVEDTSSHPPPLRRIANTLTHIISQWQGKMDMKVKQDLQEIINFAKEAEVSEREGNRGSAEQTKVSSIREAVKADLVELYNALGSRMNNMQETSKEILTTAKQTLKVAEETNADTKDLVNKIGKVTDATEKIATDTVTYRDALLARPAQTSRAGADPKVLSDMDRKAKQILVDVYGEEGDKLLSKSLTEILSKANEAIAKIEDADKPKDTKAITVLKARGHAILITLNSKEATAWIRRVENDIAFTNAFAEGSHIRERTYTLIVPRIPITFEPGKDENLREIEEVNGLAKNTISKAKWIKPPEKRRQGQTHAYALLSLYSADNANILIKDGLIICGTKIRPKKQKHEPIQCLKCRRWGHFVAECKSKDEACGNCGEKHRTNTCRNKDKVYCVVCEENSHPSWSRECPEFNRRCLILDERNPENAMPYFPTENDWTLETRPNKIPLDERFPSRYAVNSLATASNKHPGLAPRPPRRKQKHGPADMGPNTNPNLIPLPHRREEGVLPNDEGPFFEEGDGVPPGTESTDETLPRNTPGWS